MSLNTLCWLSWDLDGCLEIISNELNSAYGGHEEVARVLMTHGATLDHEDVDGDTPYTLAFNKGHRNVVMMIEEETTRRATETADKPEVQERKESLASLRKWKTR